MELSKKPVWFLCNKSAETFTISVPKTQHHFRFYLNQPRLIKFDLDIEFFDEHLMFDRVDNISGPEVSQDKEESETEGVAETEEKRLEAIKEGAEDNAEENNSKPNENPELTMEEYKDKLHNMRKSDVREILKKLNPEKSCPIRKENIIKEILKLQGDK